MSIACKRNIPNLLSIGRLVSVPIVVFLLVMDMGKGAFFLMVVLAISDMLDGYLARLWSVTSPLGAALDPLADKLFISSLVVTFVHGGKMPLWLAGIMLGRDFLILSGMGLLSLWHRLPKIFPSFLSKLNTVLQLCYLVSIMAFIAFPCLKTNVYLRPLPLFFDAPTIIEQLMIPLVASFTVLSGLQYVCQAWAACHKAPNNPRS